MNILYLHGLESKLNDEKRAVLEKYGNVIAPDLDYKLHSKIVEVLYNQFKDKGIDVIIGSSMGGFAGYYLSNLLNVPSLLYNPALPHRGGVEQLIPTDLMIHETAYKHFILGGQDEIILAKDNLEFFSKNFSSKTNYTITIKNY